MNTSKRQMHETGRAAKAAYDRMGHPKNFSSTMTGTAPRFVSVPTMPNRDRSRLSEMLETAPSRQPNRPSTTGTMGRGSTARQQRQTHTRERDTPSQGRPRSCRQRPQSVSRARPQSVRVPVRVPVSPGFVTVRMCSTPRQAAPSTLCQTAPAYLRLSDPSFAQTQRLRRKEVHVPRKREVVLAKCNPKTVVATVNPKRRKNLATAPVWQTWG
ncbi:hypothetical protein KIPB_006151 [Kipferlia bialata]|uniref:Uncharacterized protein n=1 Tax=Kipferlia bialata TaxID=797122 RepID=A0A9K3CWM7_9EUKA|nr:hypothetical protein KIPB_006151 [Kipferlia bialata]|eukprot:g6151.t1